MKVPGLRSSYENVGGLVFFGRLLDKIRLHLAGQLPPGYNFGVSDWTWFASRCTRFLNVDFYRLVERVRQGGTDSEILDWCFMAGRRPQPEEIEIWNEFVKKYGWRDASSEELAQVKRDRGFGHRDDIQTWFDFHRADEAAE